MAGFNLGIDTGLWTLMAKNGDKPQKVTDLSRELGIDPDLLSEYDYAIIGNQCQLS